MAKKGCLGCLGVIVVLLILGGIIGALSGDDRSSNSSSTSTTQEQKTDGLTYQKFVDLQMGITVEEVNKIIGINGELENSNQVGDVETKSYRWHDGMSNMGCMFQNGKMVSKSMADFSNLVNVDGKDITLEQFNNIQMGSSYEDVCKTVGREGFLSSQVNIVGHESTMYTWMNKGGGNFNVTFSNGAANMKSQFGLK